MVTFGGQGGCRSHYVIRRQFYGLLRLPIRYLPTYGAPDGSRTRIIFAWRANAIPIRRLVHLAQPTRLERALPSQVGKLSRLLRYRLLHDCILAMRRGVDPHTIPGTTSFQDSVWRRPNFLTIYWHSKQDSNLHSSDPESDALPVVLFEYIGAEEGIRTLNIRILSPTPLPIGLLPHLFILYVYIIHIFQKLFKFSFLLTWRARHQN